jgi:PAS domain S-box-containing protein
MRPDNITRHILTLTISLIIVAMISWLVMLGLMKTTLKTLESDTRTANTLKLDISQGAMEIKQHLLNAREIVHHILNHPQDQPAGDHDSRELGKLNLSIRAFAKLRPVEDRTQLAGELVDLITGFVSLHYQATNWRIEYDSFIEAAEGHRLYGEIHDYLDQLRSNLDAYIREHYSTWQPGDTLTGVLNESNRNTISTIRAVLVDIDHQVDALHAATRIRDLELIKDDLLRKSFTRLHEQIGQVDDGYHVLESPQVAWLFGMIFGKEFSAASGQPSATIDRNGFYGVQEQNITLLSRRNSLNTELDQFAVQIAGSLKRISDTTRRSLQALDTESIARSKTTWSRLLGIGLASSAAFLLLALLIFRGLRSQVHLLTRLKNQAEDASSARQSMVERLRDSETRHRTVMHTMIGAVITLNEEGFIESFNPAAEQVFGYKNSEITGKSISSLIPGHFQNKSSTGMERPGEMQDSVVIGKDIEATGHRRDGSEFPLSLAISEMWIDGRRMYTAIVTDITEQHEYEARLLEEKEKAEASNRAKDEFLATMSHEIRTPMNSIMGMSQLLLDSQLNRRQHRFVKNIHDAGKLLLGIINDILDLSRIEAHRLDIQEQHFDIVDLLHDVSRQFADTAARKGLEFTCTIPHGIHRIWIADSMHITQVLNNLVDNAIKFTRRGTIRLGVEPQDDDGNEANIVFTVEDTGTGIPAESLDKIFDSFSQADSTTTREYGGSGLGLAICKKLVERMGGNINVESEYGHGSLFRVTLRLTRGASDELKTGKSAERSMTLPALNARILLVEDNLINQEVALHMLESLSCDITLAADGIEALTLMEKQHFDLVLMDCQMPRMDGYEATRILRKREAEEEHNGRIPVIALTANAMNFDQQRCLEAGMDDYISKPLTLEHLANTMARFLPARSGGSETTFRPAAQTAGAGSRQSINSAFLGLYQEMEAGDALLDRMIDVYLQEAPSAIQVMRTAINEDDPDALSRAAHKFKSSNMQLGADLMASLCAQLDKLGQLGTTTGSLVILSDMDHEFSRVRSALSAYRRHPAAATVEHA